eukprot:SAG11_NODE_589_length_8326_cov_11.644099_3_plen_52_part_00
MGGIIPNAEVAYMKRVFSGRFSWRQMHNSVPKNELLRVFQEQSIPKCSAFD